MLRSYHLGLSGVFVTLDDMKCEVNGQRFLIGTTAKLLERDLFDDSIIGYMVHHRLVATLPKLASALFKRVRNVVTIKNDMNLVAFL